MLKTAVRYRTSPRKGFILKNSLPSSELGSIERPGRPVKHVFVEKGRRRAMLAQDAVCRNGDRGAGFSGRCRFISLGF
jgi:hypothetical protein